MDTSRVCFQPLILYIHLFTLLEEACVCVWCHRVCLRVCVSHFYANEAGSERSGCVVWCLFGGRSLFRWRTDGAGEPWSCMHVAFVLKVLTARIELHTEPCSTSPSSTPLVFLLCSDEILLFRHTASGCLSDLRYFGTKHTFCTWLKCQNAAVSDDWQALRLRRSVCGTRRLCVRLSWKS